MTQKQIDIALSLSGAELVSVCLRKIKRGELTYDELAYLCKLKSNEGSADDLESVAKDIGLV